MLIHRVQKLLSKRASRLVFTREGFSHEKLSLISKKIVSTSLGKAYTETPYTYVLPYAHTYVRSALWSYKYKNNKALAKVFASLLSDNFQRTLVNIEDPLCIYVPSSPKSNTVRYYCSNALIIKQLSHIIHAEFTYDVLKKHTGVTKQSLTRTRTERLKNPRGAFSLIKKEIVFRRNIILFDDVITTGATVKEVSRLLTKAGARSVKVIALCH